MTTASTAPAGTGSSVPSSWPGSTSPLPGSCSTTSASPTTGTRPRDTSRSSSCSKARGLIDLVGVQGHAFEYNYNNLPGSAATHTDNLARLAATDLPIYVTEFDIDGIETVWGLQDDAAQLARYPGALPGVLGERTRPRRDAVGLRARRALAHEPGCLADVSQRRRAARAAMAGPLRRERARRGDARAVVHAWTRTSPRARPSAPWWRPTPIRIRRSRSGRSRTPAASSRSIRARARSAWPRVRRSTSKRPRATRSPSPSTTATGAAWRRTSSINLSNLNDNPPAITAGQLYRIDGGSNNTVARVLATDPDDANQPGFTTFGPWAITSGDPHNVFRYDPAGNLTIARPLLIDWRRTSYTLGSTVGDGTHTSAVEAVQVVIPSRVKLCLLRSINLELPKAAVPVLILLGGTIGSCSTP